MKTTFTTTLLAIFAASTLAAPAPASTSTPATATLSFINDQSGAHAPVTAPLDGSQINLYNALTGSPVGVPVHVLVTSTQLIAYPQNVDCSITDISGTLIAQLTARQTYQKLAGTNEPVNLAGAMLECTSLLL